MGKWNQRWLPRRKYYQEPQESFHRPYYSIPESSDVWPNSVPSWEKQFCTSVGLVPWEKVVFAKHYMHCHDNVVKWNDSAGEEAFNVAKERFRAAINGLPCDIPLPDPDIFIDEIDWNPHIDRELIIDLDREYFNPDEAGIYNKVKTTNQMAQTSVSGHDLGWNGNPNNGDNKWEGDVNGPGASEDVAQGWNQLGGSINGWKNVDNANNPWEQGSSRDNGGMKDTAWSNCGDKSWGWNQGQACNDQSRKFESPWGRDCQNVGSANGKGWGGGVSNSWGWDGWETNVHQSRKFNTGDTPWAHMSHRGDGRGKNEGWGDCGDKNWGWKQCGNQSNEPKHLDSRRNGGAWGHLNGGCRKREGSHQYSSRYKSSRLHSDDYGTGPHWRNGRSQKRVSFS